MKKHIAALLALLAPTAVARAAPAPRPVVVELFTSQACSDCPPAEALLRRLQAAHPDILALALHVSYFNGPSWRDPFSSASTTGRQHWYAALRHTSEVFTPQAVIDGHASAVGSDRDAILRAIDAARQGDARPPVQVTITPAGSGWQVTVSGAPPARHATIELFRYDTIDHTAVHGGENGGRELTEIHVVRALSDLGSWTGQATNRQVPAGAGQHIAVLVQQDDGTIVGAAHS